ncbi:MAG: hypothetical protein K8S55_15930 [Phycisphaerae bacterium]|nr:hypothetical protein [Phycisphaerae bacterium]
MAKKLPMESIVAAQRAENTWLASKPCHPQHVYRATAIPGHRENSTTTKTSPAIFNNNQQTTHKLCMVKNKPLQIVLWVVMASKRGYNGVLEAVGYLKSQKNFLHNSFRGRDL